jgi:sensor histidine kinase YesM
MTWLVLWIGNSAISSPEIFVRQSLNEVWRFVFVLIANYVFFEYAVPCIRRKRPLLLYNILMGIVLVALHLFVLSFGLYGWKNLGMELHMYTSFRQVTINPGSPYDYMIEDVLYQAQGGITSFMFFGIAKLMYDNFKLGHAAQQLRLEKQEAELNYLKSQTNPHFLFNTLNNIYALAIDKSDLAPESILRLSKILRFMLYETSGKFIRAEQELEIISDYIALEKLRYDDAVIIRFDHKVDDLKQPLPPLLLIPLVENAFKHGVSETINHPFVDIHVNIHEEQLVMEVRNSTEKFSGERGVRENIGLSNIRRQLEVLYTDFNLDIQQEEFVFSATLKINLASHV